MVGAAERTVSPSSSSTRRSTPCVLGCCGPILTVIVSVRTAGMFAWRPLAFVSLAGQPIALNVLPEFLFGHLEGLRRVRRTPDLHREILPQRKAVPVLRHQQASWIGMTVKGDPEHVPDFPLEPVRCGPYPADRGDVRVRAGQPHFEPQSPPM